MSLQQEVQKTEEALQTIKSYLPRLNESQLIRSAFFYFWASTLLVLFLFNSILNFVLDIHYALPEMPRYVKTSASKIALEVNEKISAKIEEEYQIKLAKIPVDASIAGVVTNLIEGEKNIPVKNLELNSVLIGKTVNEIVGTVEADAVYLTDNYHKGMQANYVTGDKYYDVNLAVAGWQKGLFLAEKGHDEIYEINLFTASLGLVDQVDEALRIELNAFLNQSTDREYALRSYLNYLHNLENSIQNTQKKLDQQISSLSKVQDRAEKTMNKTESEFFNALRAFDENDSYRSLNRFVEDSQYEVDKKAHLQALTQVNKYLAAYLPVLEQRIIAVEANREALVHGVTVVAFRDIDLGLIKSY